MAMPVNLAVRSFKERQVNTLTARCAHWFRLVMVMMAGVLGTATAQQPAGPPAPGAQGAPRPPMTIKADPRTQQRSYVFADTGQNLAYVLYVSSKVSKARKAPLIVALHGLGGDGNFLVRDRVVDLAEEGGYIVVGPLGYNVGGWYGSPPIAMGGRPVEPANLAELSEKDVMNVLELTRKEFNVDPDRTYLMGHSMGGAGALFLGQKHVKTWAAVAAIAPAAFMMERDRAAILGTLKNAGVPVMIIQGDKDTVVPPENTRRWAETLKETGMKGEYIEIPGGDHGNVIGNGMPDIFRLFGQNTRAMAAR
jgi:predicted esterase